MATSILLHGIWNSLSSVAGSTLVFVGLLIVMIVVTLIIAVRVYALTVAPEREFMREVMSPEMARDVIGAAELDAMAGNRKALKAYRKASHNRRERKHARYVLHAAYDLADELAAARGADTLTACASPARRSAEYVRASRQCGESTSSPLRATTKSILNRSIGQNATPRVDRSCYPAWPRLDIGEFLVAGHQVGFGEGVFGQAGAQHYRSRRGRPRRRSPRSCG